MKIGALEIIVVFLIVALIFGPKKVAQYSKKLGSALKGVSKASEKVAEELRENVIAPIEEAKEPLSEMEREVRGEIGDIEKSVRDIGKPRPKVNKQEPQETEEESKEEDL